MGPGGEGGGGIGPKRGGSPESPVGEGLVAEEQEKAKPPSPESRERGAGATIGWGDGEASEAAVGGGPSKAGGGGMEGTDAEPRPSREERGRDMSDNVPRGGDSTESPFPKSEDDDTDMVDGVGLETSRGLLGSNRPRKFDHFWSHPIALPAHWREGPPTLRTGREVSLDAPLWGADMEREGAGSLGLRGRWAWWGASCLGDGVAGVATEFAVDSSDWG